MADKIQGVPSGLTEEEIQGVPEGLTAEAVKTAPATSQPAPKTPSAPSRYMSSLGETIGVPEKMSDYWSGPAYALRHPIDSAKMLYGSMVEAQHAPADQAVKDWREGKYAGAVANALYGGIPLIGPALGKAGMQFRSGDIAGGLGTTSGIAAPLLADKAPGAVEKISAVAPRVLETGGKVLANQSILDKPFKSVSSIPEYWEQTSPEAKNLARMKTEVEKANIRKAYQRLNDPLTEAASQGRAAKIPTRIPRAATAPAAGGAATAAAPAPEVNLLPEPRASFAGENEGYMASVPREELNSLATTRKPGAGTQLQQLGKPIIYVPNEAGFPGPRSTTLMNEFGQPMKPVSGGSPFGTIMAEPEGKIGGQPAPTQPAGRGLPLNPTPEQMAKRPSAIPAPEYEYKPEGVKQDTGEAVRSEKPPVPRERRVRVRTPEEQADTAAWIKARDAGDEAGMRQVEEKFAGKKKI